MAVCEIDKIEFIGGPIDGHVARHVLQNLTPVADEVTRHDDRTFMRRVTPYRTDDNSIGGVVITFVDITERKRAEEQLRELNESLEQQVTQRTEMLKLLQDVTCVANEARTIEGPMLTAMERICRYNGARLRLRSRGQTRQAFYGNHARCRHPTRSRH